MGTSHRRASPPTLTLLTACNTDSINDPFTEIAAAAIFSLLLFVFFVIRVSLYLVAIESFLNSRFSAHLTCIQMALLLRRADDSGQGAGSGVSVDVGIMGLQRRVARVTT